MAPQRFLRGPQKASNYEIGQSLMTENRGLLDSFFCPCVKSHVQARCSHLVFTRGRHIIKSLSLLILRYLSSMYGNLPQRGGDLDAAGRMSRYTNEVAD